MPRPSTSTLSRPSASRSSLSHSMKVRSSMAALPMGTTSDKGPRVSTKPPTCWERWRGKPSSSCVSSRQRESSGSVGIEPGLAHILLGQGGVAQAPDGGGERGDGVLRQAHRLADLAHRRAAAIGDDGGGDAGAVAAVAAIDILDHLLAPLMLEIDVDVRRLLPLRRDEALEQEIDLGRVDIGDGEAVADGGIRRRAAPLAEDVERAGIMHDVVHGEEIARVVELRDQRELLVERVAHLVRDAAGEAPGGALPGEIFEMRLRRLAFAAPARRDIRISARRGRSCRHRRSRWCGRAPPHGRRTAAPSPAAVSDAARHWLRASALRHGSCISRGCR